MHYRWWTLYIFMHSISSLPPQLKDSWTSMCINFAYACMHTHTVHTYLCMWLRRQYGFRQWSHWGLFCDSDVRLSKSFYQWPLYTQWLHSWKTVSSVGLYKDIFVGKRGLGSMIARFKNPTLCNRPWRPVGFLDSWLTDNGQVASLTRAGRPIHPGRFLVFISLKRLSRPRAVVQLEGLVTSLGIEPVTFRLVA
jgi:hypothetical protein